jgi:hypothetical protein
MSARLAGQRRAVCIAALLTSWIGAGAARAQGTEPPAPPPSEVGMEVSPLFGSTGPFFWGWNGFLVRAVNHGQKPMRGHIEVASVFGRRGGFVSSAPYAVGAGASVAVRVPMRVPAYAEVEVTVLDEAGKAVTTRRFPAAGAWSVLLVDATDPSALRGAIHEATVSPRYTPALSHGSYVSAPQLSLASPRFDPATGDPILPDRAALYGSASAVLFRSDILARVGAHELEALAGYVLAGGTLAIAITRPEDARNPTVAAFVGGEAAQTAVHAATLRPLILPSGSTGKSIPPARSPGDDLHKSLVGWSGGNLQPSEYGSSAHYGLGEVHLLAFDPTRKPAVDDPWVQARMVDLARAGFDRRSTVVFRQGGHDPEPDDVAQIRKQLDPNESSRWAIAAAALLLCIYAIIAGPINFAIASKRGRPLAALRWLPLMAAATFAVIVGIGIAAKGIRGRARHLTLVEAGAGMTKGTARRWRGFFASRAEELTVRTSDAGSVVASAVASSDESRDRLVVDRDGARLEQVAALPWQTVVVREDGFASLGDGVTLLADPASNGLIVVNRSGRDLRGAILKMPAGAPRYFPRIKDREQVASGAGREIGATPQERGWLASIARVSVAGTVDVHPLGAAEIGPIIDPDAPGLADAWLALEACAGEFADWLPSDVPVLLAQMDGGEGKTSDSGLRLESDRLLLRVIGYGGKP